MLLKIFTFSFVYLFAEVKSDAKIDSPSTELVLKPGENFTVLCRGNRPLKWNFPVAAIKVGEYTNFTSISVTDIKQNNIETFVSELKVTNFTFPFVGFYECCEESSEINDKIYLYINDDQHLSVMPHKVVVTENQILIIPCRPTRPQMRVELKKLGRPIRLDVIDQDAKLYRFDPHLGFITNDTYLDSDKEERFYLCIFKGKNRVEKRTVFVRIEKLTYDLPSPIVEQIENVKNQHNIIGDEIVLKCTVETKVTAKFVWITPKGRNIFTEAETNENSAFTFFRLNRTSLDDKGRYKCLVKDYQNHTSEESINVAIYGKNEHFIRLKEVDVEPVKAYKIGSNVNLTVQIDAHPEARIIWKNNRNEELNYSKSDGYEINSSPTRSSLTLKNISYDSYGNYTVIAGNQYETKNLNFFLNILGEPKVKLDFTAFQRVNSSTFINCTITSNPSSEISMEYKSCFEDSCKYAPVNYTIVKVSELQHNVMGTAIFSQSGIVKCTAKNSFGSHEERKKIFVSDIEENFGITVKGNVYFRKSEGEILAAENDRVEIKCSVVIQNSDQDLLWKKSHGILGKNDIYYSRNRTKYSKNLSLVIPKIKPNHSGLYDCIHFNKLHKVEEKSVYLNVSKPYSPELIFSNFNETTLEKNIGENLLLVCIFTGLPKPNITWYKDGAILSEETLEIESSLHINHTKVEDAGTYVCEAKNKLGTLQRKVYLQINDSSKNSYVVIFVSIVVVLAFGSSSIFFYAKKKKLEKEMREAGLVYFEKGQIENLNPDLGIDDQAEFLPYDKKWEFPIQNLKLGKQLGSGAFGVVLKGEAKGIIPGEELTTVAVKMIKRNADHVYLKALASELKIMIHLGQHLNVVNLLGACTKNVVKKELFVIVEYCKYGNLQNYLYRHRMDFINQIDPNTGLINFDQGSTENEMDYRKMSEASYRSYVPMKYAAQFSFRSHDNLSEENVSYVPKTEEGEDFVLLSNNSSVQPEWRTNYRGDYKASKPITTKDLIVWAFQVGRGMNYLASRKILHGDLAARNILLSDDNIVKICDFGLAKSMYKDDNYKKTSNSPLPIKWMAIESIRDRIFSTESDVWSFGIVLWEFFSLAQTPYPGMEADEKLYTKLVEGYRMESPEFAPKEIYQMMLDCWRKRPQGRPSFTNLVENLGKMLDENVKAHYILLNDPYLMMNSKRFEENENCDYLDMVHTPNFENLSSPKDYVNEDETKSPSPSSNSPGYLTMNNSSIFSPKPVVNERVVFTFERQESGIGNSVSDENSPNSPMLCSFSNPSYNVPCVPSKNPDPIDKRKIEEQHASTSFEHYVNNCTRNWETGVRAEIQK